MGFLLAGLIPPRSPRYGISYRRRDRFGRLTRRQPITPMLRRRCRAAARRRRDINKTARHFHVPPLKIPPCTATTPHHRTLQPATAIFDQRQHWALRCRDFGRPFDAPHDADLIFTARISHRISMSRA